MLGKNFKQVAPPIKNIAWVIPIDWVLISVGYSSAIRLCKIGRIPAFLVQMVITITAKGIQETFSKLDVKSWRFSIRIDIHKPKYREVFSPILSTCQNTLIFEHFLYLCPPTFTYRHKVPVFWSSRRWRAFWTSWRTTAGSEVTSTVVLMDKLLMKTEIVRLRSTVQKTRANSSSCCQLG